MSVIGFFVTCGTCEARMLVTPDAKDMRNCPDCLREAILAAIEDDYPIGQVSI